MLSSLCAAGGADSSDDNFLVVCRLDDDHFIVGYFGNTLYPYLVTANVSGETAMLLRSSGVSVGEPAVIGGKNFPAAADHHLIRTALKMPLYCRHIYYLDLLSHGLMVDGFNDGLPVVDMSRLRDRC